jgi:deoxyhypusine synthase
MPNVFKSGFLRKCMDDPNELEPIKHLKVEKDMKVSELVEGMGDLGFQARKISEAAGILKDMKNDGDCRIFFGLAGAMVPGGLRKIVVDMLKEGYIDVFVTTGANLTHDLIEALGDKHYKGSHLADDVELDKKNIDRIYDVYLHDRVYEKLEDFFEKIFPKLPSKMNIKEFLLEIGRNIEDKESILRVCYEKKIPIFCPGISDSGIGLMMWGRLIKGENVEEKLSKEPRISIDVFDDLREMLDLAWTCKKAGVFYIGGGLPKNFIQQAMQFSNKQHGADYGVQITTDRPEPGGSSGAPLKEGVSWGKMSARARFVDVFCDASIALPLIYGAVKC